MTTDTPIPSTRVTRVTDMRTLPNLDDDAVLLVVKNGTCWKLDFGKLRKKTLEAVLDDVQKTVDSLSSSASTAISTVNQSISQVVQKNIETTRATLSLSSNIYAHVKSIEQQHKEYIDQLSANNIKLKNLYVDIFNDMDKAKFKNIRPDLNQLKNDFISQSQSISSISANVKNINNSINQQNKTNNQIFTDINSTILPNVYKISADVQHNVKKLQTIEDSTKQSISSLNSVLDNHKKCLNDLSASELAIRQIQQQLSSTIVSSEQQRLSSTNNISKSLQKLEKKCSCLQTDVQTLLARPYEISSDIADIAKSTSAEIMNRIDMFEAKVYGITLKQEDENGEVAVEEVENGDIQRLSKAIQQIQIRIDALENASK